MNRLLHFSFNHWISFSEWDLQFSKGGWMFSKFVKFIIHHPIAMVAILVVLLVVSALIPLWVRHHQVSRVLAFANSKVDPEYGYADWETGLPESLATISYDFGFLGFDYVYSLELINATIPAGLLKSESRIGELVIRNCNVEESTLVHLFKNNVLWHIDIEGQKELETFTKIANKDMNISYLILNGDYVTDSLLKKVSDFKNLVNLDLTNAKNVTDAGFSQIIKSKSLDSMSLSCSKLTEKSLETLAKIPSVTTLILCSNQQMNENGLTALAKMPSLYSLTIQQTPLTENGIRSLSRCKNLHTLELYDVDITNEELKVLGEGKMPSLQSLWLDKNDNISAETIRYMIKQIPTLTDIDIDSNAISKAEEEELIDEFPKVGFGFESYGETSDCCDY